MGEAHGQLRCSPRHMVHEYETAKEKVLMATSTPDRPPEMHREAGELDLNYPMRQGNAGEEDKKKPNIATRNFQHDQANEWGFAPPPPDSWEDRGRKKTRWDPTPEGSNSTAWEESDDSTRGQRDQSRRLAHYNGSDLDYRTGKRYADRLPMLPGFRKDNSSYYRNEETHSRSSYERSSASSRATGNRSTGFDRRASEWSSSSRTSCSSGSTSRVQDTSRERWSRAERDVYDRRAEREVYDHRDRRDFRSVERERRREPDEWNHHHHQHQHHSVDHHHLQRNQWQAAPPLLETPRFSGDVHGAQVLGFPTFPATETGGVYMPTLVPVLPPPPLDHQQPPPPPPPFPPPEPIIPPPPDEEYQQDEEREPGQLLPEEENESEQKTSRGWVYINENGDFQGPMELAALQLLASNGFMQEDHLVMRSGSNVWVTLEHARSPDPSTPCDFVGVPFIPKLNSDKPVQSKPTTRYSLDVETNERFEIDDRVSRIMNDYGANDSDEPKTIWEALSTRRHRENAGDSSGEDSPEYPLINPWKDAYPLGFGVDEDLSMLDGTSSKVESETAGRRKSPPHQQFDNALKCPQERRWTCRGGDWKLVHPEGQSYVKIVLNNGGLLCELSNSGVDPRKQIPQSETRRRKLDLPPWAMDLRHKNDGRSENLIKPKSASFAAPPKKVAAKTPAKLKPPPDKERTKAKPLPPTPKAAEVSRETSKLPEQVAEKRNSNVNGAGEKCAPKSSGRRVVNLVDIRNSSKIDLGKGDWFYKNGSGQEHGPHSFSDLQAMVSKGTLMEGISVYRKSDDVWVPLPHPDTKDENFKSTSTEHSNSDNRRRFGHSRRSVTTNILQTIMGYTNGQLHEHVMKHYKNQVLSAFLFEGLDARAKVIEATRKLEASSTVAVDDDLLHGRSGGYLSPSSSSNSEEREDGENEHASIKRAFRTLHVNGDERVAKKRRLVYSDEFENDTFEEETDTKEQAWGTLRLSIMMRVYHHLKGDLKSLMSVSAACKTWRSAALKFKPKVKCLDLSTLGSRCSEAAFESVQGYGGGQIKQLILRDCTLLGADTLRQFLETNPSVTDVEINGCDQFGDLVQSFPRVNWVFYNEDSDVSDTITQGSENSNRKMKSLKLIGATRRARLQYDEDEAEPMDVDTTYGDHDLESITQHSGRKRVKLNTAAILQNGRKSDIKKKKLLALKKLNRPRRSAKGMLLEGLDEDLASALKQLVSADTYKWFYQKTGQRMDLATMEKKLGDGFYSGGKAAFASFKTDLYSIPRWALKMDKESPQYIAGQKIMADFEKILGTLEATYFSKPVSELSLSNGLSGKHVLKGKNQKSDQQKGKAAVKKRKLSSKQWSESESESSDATSYEAGETESETETETGEPLDLESQPCDTREWGARMTKAAMVPPVTRTYEVVQDYSIVIDHELVERRMKVEVPDDFEEKLRAMKLKPGGDFIHLEVPEIKEACPRRELGIEVLEQEVYGIDPYTHNLLLDTLPKHPPLTDAGKRTFVEERILQALNADVRQFTGTGKAPMEYSLDPVVQRMVDEAQASGDAEMEQLCHGLLKNMRSRTKEKYVAYRKGLGVVCNKEGGFEKDDFVVGFLGEVYPSWRWYEKQDGCRALQQKNKDPAPEFYNIMLERPKGDAAGYDLLVVDAMHKANYASRICHSCRPNCEAKVTAVNMRYTIGVYTLRPIQNGEELTFDYNSVTESKEEYNNSICLCGSQGCRGSYLNLAGGGTFQEVIKECHGLLDRHVLLLEACCDGPVTRHELDEMKMAGVGSCLLDGLPDWLLKYTARLVEFMNLERQRLPEELLRGVKKNRKHSEFLYEMDRSDAEVQAEGVFNQRLQNLAITLDKVRYVLRQFFTDPREAPPLLKRLDQKELVARLWSGDNSIVNDLLKCMTPHIPEEKMVELKHEISEHSPDERGESLRDCLLWLRDRLRSLESTFLSRHDAAADLIHMYAYTQCFFTSEEYGTFESPPLQINAQDLGRHANTGPFTWKKVYNKDYVLGQLIFWFKQSSADPGANLVQGRRGCLVLPDVSSCYAKGLQQDSRRAYGSKVRAEMLPRMERQPQKQWPKSQFWEFKSSRGLFGSPMLDAVQRGGHIDGEMMHWLKSRPVNFVGPYDEL